MPRRRRASQNGQPTNGHAEPVAPSGPVAPTGPALVPLPDGATPTLPPYSPPASIEAYATGSNPNRGYDPLAAFAVGETRGRRLTLNADIIKRLTWSVRNGNYNVTACQAAGIPYNTFTNWMRKGRRDYRNGETSTLFAQLWAAIVQAEGRAVEDAVEFVYAQRDPALKLQFLARKKPELWGLTTQKKMIHSGSVSVKPGRADPCADLSALSPQERKEYLRLMEKVHGKANDKMDGPGNSAGGRVPRLPIDVQQNGVADH